MYIKNILLKNFGKYKNNDNSISFDNGLNIVYGHNEIGKSTLFNAIISVLYGYKPANRDDNKYVPWDSNVVELEAQLNDVDGDFELKRKLLSSVTGKLIRGGKEEKINNKSLKNFSNISRIAYESIYALTLNDVVQMEQKSWAEIEDRLITNYGMDEFLSPREIINNLDDEMKKIYNSHGKAKNTSLKILQNELKDLKAEKNQILENIAQLEDTEQQIKELNLRIDDLRLMELDLETQLNWWEKHQKLINVILDIEAIRDKKKAKNFDLKDVPDGIHDYESLNSKISELKLEIKELTEQNDKNKQRLYNLTQVEELYLKNSDEILRQLNKLGKLYSDKNINDTIQNRIEDRLDDLKLVASDITNIDILENLKKFIGINVVFIESKINEIDNLKMKLSDLHVELNSKNAYKSKLIEAHNVEKSGLEINKRLDNLIYTFPLIITLILWLYAAGKSYDTKFILLLLPLLMLWAKYWNNRMVVKYDGKNLDTGKQLEAVNREIDKLDLQISGIKDKLESLNLEIDTELLYLDIADSNEYNANFLASLTRAKKLAFEIESIQQKYILKRDEIDTQIYLVCKNLKSLGVERDLTDTDIQTVIDLIEGINKKNHHNEKITTEIDINDARLAQLNQQYQNLLKPNEKMSSYLLKLGNGNIDDGIHEINTWTKLLDREKMLIDILETEDPSGIMREEINKFSEKEVNINQKKIELDNIKREINNNKIQLTKLETGIEYLKTNVDLFDVESNILAVQDEIETQKIEYDKLLLLKTLVETHDKAYREQHQPNIHRMTGKYFNAITLGKYKNIYNDDSISGTNLFTVEGDFEIDVDMFLSQGTKDQLYLALRLALVDELDKDTEKLPLFLDEIFVNWDSDRLKKGIELIMEISKFRQVIIFTCHKWLVDEISFIGNINLIKLDEYAS